MRIVTGDLHLSHNPRDEYRFDFMRWLAAYARKRKPDQVIIAGDLTEEKDRHPAILVNKVVEHVHALSKICNVAVIEGNHDYKDEGHAFFHFLSRIPNTRWISRPTILSGDVLALPHTNEHKSAWADIEMADYPLIICHQTFNGSNIGFGRKLDGIPIERMPRKSLTLSGDIHVPQTLARNIVCIGAPYHVDFGDDYASRIIEIDGKEWTSIDTASLPQKRSLVCKSDDGGLKGVKANAGDVCQITVELDSMEEWPAVRDKIARQAEKRKLRVWAIKPLLTKRAVRRKHKVVETATDVEIIDAFGKRHGLDERTLATGHKLCD